MAKPRERNVPYIFGCPDRFSVIPLRCKANAKVQLKKGGGLTSLCEGLQPTRPSQVAKTPSTRDRANLGSNPQLRFVGGVLGTATSKSSAKAVNPLAYISRNIYKADIAFNTPMMSRMFCLGKREPVDSTTKTKRDRKFDLSSNYLHGNTYGVTQVELALPVKLPSS